MRWIASGSRGRGTGCIFIKSSFLMADSRYYTELAAAFVRGRLGIQGLDPDECIELGKQRGLRIHKFKRTGLPRVVKVIGILKGLMPSNLLDVGSGRGAFLWPTVFNSPTC